MLSKWSSDIGLYLSLVKSKTITFSRARMFDRSLYVINDVLGVEIYLKYFKLAVLSIRYF